MGHRQDYANAIKKDRKPRPRRSWRLYGSPTHATQASRMNLEGAGPSHRAWPPRPVRCACYACCVVGLVVRCYASCGEKDTAAEAAAPPRLWGQRQLGKEREAHHRRPPRARRRALLASGLLLAKLVRRPLPRNATPPGRALVEYCRSNFSRLG